MTVLLEWFGISHPRSTRISKCTVINLGSIDVAKHWQLEEEKKRKK